MLKARISELSAQVFLFFAEKHYMNAPKFLIMNILRIITPEEIGEITTKHNGGKFASLTDLIDERLEKNIFRDFSISDAGVMHEAKILPFKRNDEHDVGDVALSAANEDLVEQAESAIEQQDQMATASDDLVEELGINEKQTEVGIETNSESHRLDENMSSFILIEKERFKKNQQVLKKKEIMDLYQQTSKVEVEQIKHTNQNLTSSTLGGVLINKKQY